MKIKRAHSVEDINSQKFKTLPLQKDWLPHLGEPQLGNSSWLVYGESGHGKTSYVLQVVKMLTDLERIHYNTLEEGMKQSFKLALKRNNMKTVASRFNFQQESLEELTKRLDRPRQPKIVVIDSVQYFFRGKQLKHYFDFINKFPNTTFIWVSGADGKNPKGSIADGIFYDSDIVINVKDFEAIVKKNRFEATESHIIWKEGNEKRNIELLTQG